MGGTSTHHFLFCPLQWWDLWEESPSSPAVGSWGLGLVWSVGGACRASSSSWVKEAASPRFSSTSSLHTDEKDLQEEQRLCLRCSVLV